MGMGSLLFFCSGSYFNVSFRLIEGYSARDSPYSSPRTSAKVSEVRLWTAKVCASTVLQLLGEV